MFNLREVEFFPRWPTLTTAPVDQEEQQFFLSTLSPSQGHKRLALAVVLALLAAFFLTIGPLRTFHPVRIDAFTTAYAAAMIINELITAVLLFAQFSVLRSRALLVIASGYLFTALTLIPWTLTFPGLLAPMGLLGGGLQSTIWLYILWHAGFPVFVIAYALLKDADPARRLWRGSAGAAILSSVAATVVLVCAEAFLVTAGEALLPRVMLDTVHRSTFWFYPAGVVALLSILALIVLWVRRRSVLDLWLLVVMCAHLIDICLDSSPPLDRFSVGWYASRISGLMSSILVLCVLLYEITKLYAQLLGTARARGAANAELAQRSEELARSNAELEQMAYVASHDLQEPLRMVASYLQLLEQRYGGRLDANAHEFIGFAVDGAKRMQTLIDDLLAYSRVSTRAQAPEPTDSTALVATALHSLRVAIEESGAQVQCGALPVVMGDAVQLTQLFQNVLSNAIKFRGQQAPRIAIWAEPDDGFWRFAVQDNGIGIAPEYFDRIFVMFQRLHNRTKYPGTGIGLAICKKIVERHGGRIWVEAAPQQGCIFKFTLPLARSGP